jgi:hypothetical protein
MSLLAAWVLFPGALLALTVGRLPGPLVPISGLAVIVVGGQFLTWTPMTAELLVGATVALAIAGLAAGRRRLGAGVDGWAAAAALASFALLAAPIVLSGEATFAGYVKLDDTATWMALTDRVIESGRTLGGLAPSTYEATLAFNLGEGYPVGAFLPLGIASAIAGQDVAWTIQPYMAALGAALALGLWQLAAPVLASRPLRALVAVVGSQAALLYGYYLWGGVKEIAAAALLASAVPLAIFAADRGFQARAMIPLALVCAALLGVLSAAGAIWLVAPLAGAVCVVLTTTGARRAVRAALVFGALVASLALPVLTAGGLLPPTASPLTSEDALGNLIEPLEAAQLAGIWPAGDFRVDPTALPATTLLVVVAICFAVGALVLAWRRRAWGVPLYVGGALLGCALICALGSPWVDGKALATASPAIPFAAALGGAALWARGRRAEGAVALVAVAGGVLWSNALQYRDVDLAPRDQLSELERIGERIDGEGPTLMTEYQPYGARHFLRGADPEAASELRRRPVPLVSGRTLAKGRHADTDRLDPRALVAYRTLVLRRTPAQSRPPSPFELAWRGDFYEVWQRPAAGFERVIRHVGLGEGESPVGRPSCDKVRELAARAAGRGTLTAASRPGVTTVRPAGATVAGIAGGEFAASMKAPRASEYEFWLGGSVRSRAELLVDGRPAGEVRHHLNHAGLYTRLGEARLEPGRHDVVVRFAGPDMHPGSGGSSGGIGPLVLTDSDAAEAHVLEVSAAKAQERLCGRRWDWIELVGA